MDKELKALLQEKIEKRLTREFTGWTITYDLDGNVCDNETFAYEATRGILSELFGDY